MDFSYRVHCVLIASQLTQTGQETLESLRSQDYENLEISQIDISGLDNPAIKNNFSAAANLVLDSTQDIQGQPDYFLFIKDGALLAPTAVSELISCAEQFNAGVVGPKLTSKTNPGHIQGAGICIDKTGAAVPRVLSEELDQGQYDKPEQVFAIDADCMLIRRDLFFALGGFDKSMPRTSQNIDFCWRAQLAGAAVATAPGSVCALPARKSARISQFSFPEYRCQIKMMLANYGLFHLLRILPQALLVAVLGIFWNLIILEPRKAGYILDAWFWNLLKAGSTFKKRRSIRATRIKTDREVRNRQEKGLAPLILYFQDTEEHYAGLKRFLSGKGIWAAWLGILAVFAFGSRHLITQSVPVVGEFLPFQDNFLSDFFSSRQTSGLGFDGLSPGAEFWLGIVNLIFFGYSGLARMAFISSLFILGGLGIWHLLGKLAKAPAAKAISAAAYMAIPLPYIALRNGDLDSLVLFGAAPWILSLLLGRKNFWPQSLVLGMVMGLATVFSIYAFMLLAVLALASILSGVLTGLINFRPLGIALLGGVFGILLNFSFNLSLGVQLLEWRPGPSGELELWDLMIFNLNQLSAGFLVWAALGAAAVLVLLARGQAGVWLAHAWVLYLAGISLAWMGEQDLYRIANPEVFLVPSALGLAMALGLGAEVREQAKMQSKARSPMRWRKILTGATGLALIAGAVPILVLSLDGRWDLPPKDYQTTLNSLSESSQRVLWIGHPDILGTGSWQLTDEAAFSITYGSAPSIEQKWLRPKDDSIKFLENELDKLNSINRLGGRLAFFGISHIVLLEGLYPESEKFIPVNSGFHSDLDEQIDLRRLDTTDGIAIYENMEIIPVKAVLPQGTLENATLDPSSAVEVFRQKSTEADFPRGDFYLAGAARNWNFTVEGKRIEPVEVFGWAGLYSQSEYAGLKTEGVLKAGLEYETSGSHRMFLAAQILLWVVFLFFTAWIYRHKKARGEQEL